MIQHVAYHVIRNDTLVGEVVGVLDPRRLLINGCHIVEQCGPPAGVDEERGFWEVWDEALEGHSSRMVVLPPGQHSRSDIQSMGHEDGVFPGC